MAPSPAGSIEAPSNDVQIELEPSRPLQPRPDAGTRIPTAATATKATRQFTIRNSAVGFKWTELIPGFSEQGFE